jgi:CIC family chloride channel protein
LYGVGYPPLVHAIHGDYALWLLLALLAGKILATSLTIAIGGSGGVFAPSLFMGAMLGSAYGTGVHHVLPGLTGPAGAYGLVGMGAVFAGAARAPITAVIIIFELTGDYRIILPLMFAIALAAGISNLLSPDTIYTLKLRRRGVDIMRGRGANLMQLLHVADAMQPVPTAVPAEATLNEVIALVGETSTDGLPVTDADGFYHGTISFQQVEEAMRENALDATAGDLAQDLPALKTGQTLEQALSALLRGRSGLPVVDGDDPHPVGWLTPLDVLRAYNTRLQQGIERTSSEPTTTPSQPGLAQGMLARLRGYRIVDLELATHQPPVGRRISDIGWPARSTVLALRRGDDAFEPEPDDRLQHGDRLTVLVPASAADELVDTVVATSDEQAAGAAEIELDARPHPEARRGSL